MIFHIQYYIHAHENQSLDQAIRHTAENSLSQTALFGAILLSLIFTTFQMRGRIAKKIYEVFSKRNHKKLTNGLKE